MNVEHRRRLQAEVQRQQAKRIAVQRVVWSIIAVAVAIGAVVAFFAMQNAMDRPERCATRFMMTRKSRAGYKAQGYTQTVGAGASAGFIGAGSNEMPSFYWVKVTSTGVVKAMGKDNKEPVDVIIIMEGEEVVGTSAAAKKVEKGEKRTATHRILQHWQKLRNGEFTPRGKWKVLATEVYRIQQSG
jgi:hypothetical protein